MFYKKKWCDFPHNSLKFIVTFFLCCSTSITHSQETKYLSKDSTSLRKAIRLIERNEPYHFFYNSTIIDGRKRVFLKPYSNIRELLDGLFKDSTVGYRILDNTIVLFREDKSQLPNTMEESLWTVRFRIFDGLSNEPLLGALVQSENKRISGVSNHEGTLSISFYSEKDELPLNVRYLGYRSIDTLISLSKVSKSISLALIPETFELSEVIVNARVKKNLKEVNAQKNAINQIQVLASDTKDRLPDQNMGEALQRMTGTTIGRSYGEGNTVAIRGTPISYTTIQYNGENLPTTEIDGRRNTIVAGIGVDQSENVQVIKTKTPDTDGDAIGGSVNLIPVFSLSKELALKAELGSGYNNLSKGYNLTGMLTLEKRYLVNEKYPEGRLGIKVGGNYYRTDNGRDRLEIDWDRKTLSDGNQSILINNYNWRDLQNERTRSGYNTSIDYKLRGNGRLYAHLMYNNLTDDEIRNRIRYRPLQGNYVNATRVDDARVERDLRDRRKIRKNTSVNLGIDSYIGNWKFDASFFYTMTDRTDESIRATFEFEDVDLLLSEVNTDYPKVNGAMVDLDDVSLYTLESIRPSDLRSVTGENLVFRMDFKKPINTFFGKGELQTGLKYRKLKNGRQRWVSIYENSSSDPLNLSTTSISVPDNDFMQGNLNFDSRIDTGTLVDYFNENQTEFSVNQNRSARVISEFFTRAEEDIMAAYAMATFKGRSWDVLTGLRLEKNRGTYRANEVVTNNDGSPVINPIVSQKEYTIPLPNFQVKYELSERSQARFALTNGFTRPEYNSVSPSRVIDIEDREVFLGNPNLNPTRSINLDLAYEYYLGDIGYVSASGFYKRITDFIYQIDRTVVGDEWENADNFIDYELTSFENGEYANLWGLELTAQTRLNFLPGFLKYFSVSGNISLTHSEAVAERGEVFRLPGQAQNFGNMILSYNKKGFSAGLAFNYIDDFVFSIGNTREEDFLFDSRYQIDANISQNIGKHFKIYAEGINLSDQPLRGFFGSDQRVSELEVYSWWVRFGIGYKF
ncbi:TonB-dependent receptor [Flagellimonas meridianipacifica]|uniref:TonB-dependent receptor n=1 Tax=Flagellimonas meridianipacifica TaxID=1080225 RepID=A0A2T0M8L4_9FLAO|nr:TonB-dependent receptor [Allomuricauda pacifica]